MSKDDGVFRPGEYKVEVTVITPHPDFTKSTTLKRIEMFVQTDFTKGYERWFVAERLHINGRRFDTIWWLYCDNFQPKEEVDEQYRQRLVEWLDITAGTESKEKQSYDIWGK